MIKIVIADDHELIRQSLKIILDVNPDMEVVDTVGDGDAAMRSVARHRPDIILMDVRMPGMDGVACTSLIRRRYPQTKVIILTTFSDDEYIFGAIKNGASGYLLKGSGLKELSDAIRVVYNGGAIMNPNVASKMMQQFSDMAKNSTGPQNEGEADVDLHQLSRNEWKVIRTVGQGMSNKEIAAELCLSEGTVRNLISSVLSKLELRDRTQLAIWAVRHENLHGPEED